MQYICRACRNRIQYQPRPTGVCRCSCGLLNVCYRDDTCPFCEREVEIKCKTDKASLPRVGEKINDMIRNLCSCYKCCPTCNCNPCCVQHPLPPGCVCGCNHSAGGVCCRKPSPPHTCCCDPTPPSPPHVASCCDCCDTSPSSCVPVCTPCCPVPADCDCCCAIICKRPSLYCKLSLATVGVLLMLTIAMAYYYYKNYYLKCSTVRRYKMW